jgi:signal transduction histidine kinase
VVTLEHSRLFSGLGPEEARVLRAIALEQTFSAGQEIFRESDAGDGLYLVKDGQAEISVTVSGGRHVFAEVGPGDFFGEMAVLEDKARSASAVAMKESVVYFIPRAKFLELVERSPTLALALLREISHRLREFNGQHLRQVLQAERLAIVGRFARSIVHDLKNPLNVIGLTAEMAGMSQAPPEVRDQAVNTIRLQVDRINDLVSEIMDFTQGTSEDLVLPAVSYARFVEQMAEELRAEAALRNVTVEVCNPAPDLPVVINPKRLRRVFHNLAQNATEAMTEGGRLLLRFEATPTEIITEMEDTGPGIAPEIAGQLFQAFATHGKTHGTGLGLSICRRILEDHQGWIAARRRPGRGAVFAFGLPRPKPAGKLE